ncbi:2-oxoadipate dioxygenase/decarboxylase family protein [Novosphingobium sp. EMRT-2]|uniref:2-oxoadipate dioxygenase/decarboxylase family protein n=1 Tax=Novosphingobium sp. EMRT-2 TaxID=2571749 RepID=UPI0010BE08AB|nr:DUF1338 family protein [Novosphingobium sp. EMRT-2]QCI94674.1 DUF1338 family protein [Novosphingobium sp. EMRT-2]
MIDMHDTAIARLVEGLVGPAAAQETLARIAHLPETTGAPAGMASRLDFTWAMNAALFADLLERVPTGRAYVADRIAAGERIRFDHGALRTIRFPSSATGAMAGGIDAFRRILEPLGYRVAAVYPLPRLRMTGFAFRHLGDPENVPQFFVSELDVGQFDGAFGAAAHRVFDSSRDPLDDQAKAVLARFASEGTVPLADALPALRTILTAFGRQHAMPALADYETLLAQSAEAAWIATEGNSFNHVTDRVDDVDQVAAQQRALGRPIKDRVEVSANGRVRQTAFRADPVQRFFRDAQGRGVEREVPGSFYEFITRDREPLSRKLDLSFDSANATGIFTMTRAA